MLRAAAFGAGLLLGSASATRAQAAEPADSARRERLLVELRALATLEARAVAESRRRAPVRRPAGTAAPADAAGDHRRTIEAVLDTLVLQRDAGADALASLERAYPGSPLLLRTRADLAMRDGRPAEALPTYERLLRAAPRDATIARRRARALLLLPDATRALAAWTSVLDAIPEDRESFDTLLRLRAATGTLALLEAQLQRLRLLSGDSLLIRRREAEVAAWRQRQGGPP